MSRLNRISLTLISSLIFLLSFGLSASAQDQIRVQGKITDISTGEPIAAVNVIVDGYVLAYSDIDGNYVCTVARNDEIIFYSGQHEEVKVKVNNRQVINVQMQVLTIELSEAVVTASFGNTTVYVEPSDLQIVGDHFILKTSVRIPKKKFDSNSRFIFQPTLYNATLKDTSYFRPVVIDGENYHINQQRYFAFDPSLDRLADYVVTNELNQTDHIYAYKDSLYIAPTDMDHDYRSDCYIGINGLFRKETARLGSKSDYTDTLVIALKNTNKIASEHLIKLLKSAVANAEHNFNMNAGNLYVSECFVCPGPTLKRVQPRAQGRAFQILKRTSHVTLVVKEKEVG